YVGGVERDKNGVEREAAHCLEQDRRIMVSRQAEMFDASLGPGHDQRLERAAFAENHVEIVERAQVVELPEIEVIGAEAAQRVVEQAQRTIAGAIVRLRGEEDLLPAFAQGGAVVVDAAGVGGSGIAVGDSLIEGAGNHAGGGTIFAPRAQDSFTT